MKLKQILAVVCVLLFIVSCGTQRYVTNTNTDCTNTYISEELYNFNIGQYNAEVTKAQNNDIYIYTDSLKIHLLKMRSRLRKDYMSIHTSLKNNKSVFYVYDTIGRLIKKFDDHSGTDIGERITYKYANIKSKVPIEISRVNYDTIYPICWKEALRIAKRKGVKLKEVEIDVYYPLDEDEKKDPTREWVISDEKHTMTVNVYTGKASKLKKKYISGHGPM